MNDQAMKILVVDDDAFVRDMLSTILESSGYGVVTAENGTEALERYGADGGIDLIVSDVNMPGMDGVQLIKELRRNNHDVPIIILTSVGSIAVAVEALNSGASDYVLKDESIQDTIIITVKKAIEKHRMKQHNIQLVADLALKTAELEHALSSRTAIINNMPDGLLVTDADYRITLANPALVRMFGLERMGLEGKDCRPLFSDNLVSLLDKIRSEQEAVFTAQLELQENRTGSAIVSAIRRKQHSPSGQDEFIGALVIVRDVTSEKEIERMKDDFIATVSHELRTPLTSVLGFTRVIQKKLDEVIFPHVPTHDAKVTRAMTQVSDNIRIIMSEGERLTTLINDVLDLSKMEAGKIVWRMEPVAIEEVLDRAVAATASLFENKGIDFNKVIGPGQLVVTGDRDRLIQVVINLVSNALKFTDKGSVTAIARMVGGGDAHDGVLSGFEHGAVLVSIADTGIGISEKDCALVFEKFKQVGDTLTDRPKGTGLGLPICKQIVEHHGGRIWAESRVGEGSTFSFTLPCAVPDQEQQQ
ncbi:MAG TPA: response regulator [Desulfuromonadaceae bacterium]